MSTADNIKVDNYLGRKVLTNKMNANNERCEMTHEQKTSTRCYNYAKVYRRYCRVVISSLLLLHYYTRNLSWPSCYKNEVVNVQSNSQCDYVTQKVIYWSYKNTESLTGSTRVLCVCV